MKKIILTLVSGIVTLAFVSLITYFVYNKIAWDFNLAPANYWTCVGTVYVLQKIFNAPQIEQKKQEDK